MIAYHVLMVLDWFIRPQIQEVVKRTYTVWQPLLYQTVLLLLAGALLARGIRSRMQGMLADPVWYGLAALDLVILVVQLVRLSIPGVFPLLYLGAVLAFGKPMSSRSS